MKFADVDGQRTPAFPKGLGHCRACKAPTHAKCGEFVRWHWAHKRGTSCGDRWWEPESAWHRAWKDRFSDDWQEVPVFDEALTDCHIADVKTPAGLVLEFQRSTIHPDDVRARQDFYGRMLWIIDGLRSSFDKIYFGLSVHTISKEEGLADFRWCGRSKLIHRWHTTTPVFIDFGPEVGFWRILRFDRKTQEGRAGAVDIASFVDLVKSGTTDFSTCGGPAST